MNNDMNNNEIIISSIMYNNEIIEMYELLLQIPLIQASLDGPHVKWIRRILRININLGVIGSFRLFISNHRIFTMFYWFQRCIVGGVRSIVKRLGLPIINEHTITLHFDRYLLSRNYFVNFIIGL